LTTRLQIKIESKSCASCSPFWLEQAKEGLLNRLTGSLGIDLAGHDLIAIPVDGRD